MKKTLLLILLALPLSLFAQKIKSDKVDDFTGKRVAYTSNERLTGGMFTAFYYNFRIENDVLQLDVNWACGEVTACNEGSNLTLKMSDNSIIKLSALSYTISDAKVVSNSIMHSLSPTYIFKEKIKSDIYPVKMRIQTTGGYVDLDIKEDNGRKFTASYMLLSGTKDAASEMSKYLK